MNLRIDLGSLRLKEEEWIDHSRDSQTGRCLLFWCPRKDRELPKRSQKQIFQLHLVLFFHICLHIWHSVFFKKKKYKSVVCKALWHAVFHVLSTAHEEEKIPHLAEKETCARILSVNSRAHLDLNLTLKDYYFHLGVWFSIWFVPYCWSGLCITVQLPASLLEKGAGLWIPSAEHEPQVPTIHAGSQFFSHCVPPPPWFQGTELDDSTDGQHHQAWKRDSATHNFTLKISLWKCVAESQSWQGNVTQARPFRQWTPWGSTWGPRAWSFPDLGWQLLRPSWKNIPCTTTEVETLGSCGEVCPKVF